jgi:hypothetical protein
VARGEEEEEEEDQQEEKEDRATVSMTYTVSYLRLGLDDLHLPGNGLRQSGDCSVG